MKTIRNSIDLFAQYSKGTLHSSIHEFKILNHFKVSWQTTLVSLLILIHWKRHPSLWFKCNKDGEAKGHLGYCDIFVGGFFQNLETSIALHVELTASIVYVAISYDRGWFNLWLKCDSTLNFKALDNFTLISWQLQNRWSNYLNLIKKINWFQSFSHF